MIKSQSHSVLSVLACWRALAEVFADGFEPGRGNFQPPLVVLAVLEQGQLFPHHRNARFFLEQQISKLRAVHHPIPAEKPLISYGNCCRAAQATGLSGARRHNRGDDERLVWHRRHVRGAGGLPTGHVLSILRSAWAEDGRTPACGTERGQSAIQQTTPSICVKLKMEGRECPRMWRRQPCLLYRRLPSRQGSLLADAPAHPKGAHSTSNRPQTRQSAKQQTRLSALRCPAKWPFRSVMG